MAPELVKGPQPRPIHSLLMGSFIQSASLLIRQHQCLEGSHPASTKLQGQENFGANPAKEGLGGDASSTHKTDLRVALVAASAMCPHVDKVVGGGEDACLVLPHEGVLAVADGVGGWSHEGIDAALYARGLMGCCGEAVMSVNRPRRARQILQAAQDVNKLPGSSTACLAVLEPCGRLEVANVGDSGLRVMRGGKIIFKTRPQQHSFNHPFQLAHSSFHHLTSTARDHADTQQVQVKAGDIIILATDGVFDNLSDEALLGLVRFPSPLPTERSAHYLAEKIVAAARQCALDPSAVTPWSEAAMGAGLRCHGGKMDDCTAVVAVVYAPRARPARQYTGAGSNYVALLGPGPTGCRNA